MEEASPKFELQEPVSPETLLPSFNFTPVWIALTALLLITVIILVVRAFSSKGKSDPLAARRAAYIAAKKRLESAEEPGIRETAVNTSLILRRFLSDAVGDPSLFETHEEFLTRHDSLNKLTPPAREACTTWFQRVARLKYAPVTPADDSSALAADARELLETLNGGLTA